MWCLDIETETKRRLELDKNTLRYKAAMTNMTSKLIEDKSVVEDWEMRMANALNSIDAKNVIVEFEMNGVRGAEKITRDNLLIKLCKKDTFSYYSFSTQTAGKKLMAKLGASNWYNDDNALRCEHIVRITYGKKTVYER